MANGKEDLSQVPSAAVRFAGILIKGPIYPDEDEDMVAFAVIEEHILYCCEKKKERREKKMKKTIKAGKAGSKKKMKKPIKAGKAGSKKNKKKMQAVKGRRGIWIKK